MIQIAYQPIFDPFHAVFRLMRLSAALEQNTIPFHTVRIADFFLCFPHFLNEIRMPTSLRSSKKIARGFSDQRPYMDIPDKILIFERMRLFHDAAAQTLAVRNYIDQQNLKVNKFKRTSAPFPTAIKDRINEINGRERLLISILSDLMKIDLEGRDGLKHRTGLGEYRYDAV